MLQQLYRQETHIEMEFLGEKTVIREDLISSTKTLASLASLYRSVVSNGHSLSLLHSHRLI